MPLLFDSLNKGKIVFGFFNIETDMLLLENYFFFASDFCYAISEYAKNENYEKFITKIFGYVISDNEKIGDLMGAIHGIRFVGFIGEVYKVFPFPSNLDEFKQSPDGYKNRRIIEELILKFGIPKDINFQIKDGKIFIEEYAFTSEQFFKLIQYVIVGGYPRWKNDIKPYYVESMIEGINKSNNPFLKKV